MHVLPDLMRPVMQVETVAADHLAPLDPRLVSALQVECRGGGVGRGGGRKASASPPNPMRRSANTAKAASRIQA